MRQSDIENEVEIGIFFDARFREDVTRDSEIRKICEYNQEEKKSFPGQGSKDGGFVTAEPHLPG